MSLLLVARLSMLAALLGLLAWRAGCVALIAVSKLDGSRTLLLVVRLTLMLAGSLWSCPGTLHHVCAQEVVASKKQRVFEHEMLCTSTMTVTMVKMRVVISACEKPEPAYLSG